MAQGKDADVSSFEELGMIPAGTLLKTEFSAVVPEEGPGNKLQVSGQVYISIGWCNIVLSPSLPSSTLPPCSLREQPHIELTIQTSNRES